MRPRSLTAPLPPVCIASAPPLPEGTSNFAKLRVPILKLNALVESAPDPGSNSIVPPTTSKRPTGLAVPIPTRPSFVSTSELLLVKVFRMLKVPPLSTHSLVLFANELLITMPSSKVSPFCRIPSTPPALEVPTSPLIVSRLPGELVPMPTSPADVMRRRSGRTVPTAVPFLKIMFPSGARSKPAAVEVLPLIPM
jgi:hypothetical protein